MRRRSQCAPRSVVFITAAFHWIYRKLSAVCAEKRDIFLRRHSVVMRFARSFFLCSHQYSLFAWFPFFLCFSYITSFGIRFDWLSSFMFLFHSSALFSLSCSFTFHALWCTFLLDSTKQSENEQNTWSVSCWLCAACLHNKHFNLFHLSLVIDSWYYYLTIKVRWVNFALFKSCGYLFYTYDLRAVPIMKWEWRLISSKNELD